MTPCLTTGRTDRGARELVPAAVEEIGFAVGARRPDHLVDRFDDIRQERAALLQLALNPLALGDLEEQHGEALAADGMGPSLVRPVVQRRHFHFEGHGIAALDDGFVPPHDVFREVWNDLAGAMAKSRSGTDTRLLREGVVHFEEHEVGWVTILAADQFAHAEAFADLAEQLAAMLLAQSGCTFGRFRHQLSHPASRSFSERNESSRTDVPARPQRGAGRRIGRTQPPGSA
jgi:hypothetical protein